MKTQTVCVLNLGVVLALVTVVAVTNSSGGAANAAAPTIATPNAENVELVGHIGGATVAVFVQGNYAYVGMGPELAVLDISDPTHPVRVGYVVLSDMELSTVHDIYVAGNYAYVAADSAGLRVVDVSRSTAPVEVGYYDIQGYATDVAVAGNYAYVIDFMRHVLHIVDITNPVAPVNVGVYDPPGWIVPYDVVVVGDYAYVANGGLQVVDVSDPTAPVLVSSLDTCGRARSVAVAGGYAYVTSDLNYTVADIWYAELNVVDISDPTLPVRVGICDTLKAAYDVAVIGDYAYVAGGEEGGLRVVDDL
jgi:hypothetical protein